MNVENKLQAIEKIGEDLAGMAENDGDFQKPGHLIQKMSVNRMPSRELPEHLDVLCHQGVLPVIFLITNII